MRARFIPLTIWTLLFAATTGQAEEVPVNIVNFVTAQTAMQFDTYQNKAGGVNKVLSTRDPVHNAGL